MGGIPGLDPFGLKYHWPFQSCSEQSGDIGLPTSSSSRTNEQFRNGGKITYATPLQEVPTSALVADPPEEVMDLDLPNQISHRARSRRTNASDARPVEARDSGEEKQQVSASSETSPPDTVTLSHKFAARHNGTDNEKQAVTSRDVQHRRMQELSELAMSLYAQLLASDPEYQQPNPNAKAAAFQEQLVGSVLKYSNKFLELLDSFMASTASSSTACPYQPLTPSVNSEKYPCSRDSASSSSLASFLDHDYSIMSVPVPPPQCERPTSRSSESKPFAPADLTTVLQLLTCYMRIIHLHSIMHAHILDYALTFPPPRTLAL